MMLGGLGDGCGELRAGLRQPSGIPAFFAASFGRMGGEAAGQDLSESVGISARAMQRFLTEARWSDETVIVAGILGPQAGTPGGGVGVRWPTSPRGRKSWPGSTAAGWAWPTWDVLLRQPAGPGVGGQAAVSAQEFRPGPVCWAGVPEDRRNYRSKTELAPDLEMLERVLELGYLRAECCRRRRLRDVADLPGGTGGPGDALRAGRSGRHSVWPLDPAWTVRNIRGRPPPQTQAAAWAAADHGAAVLPDEAWREITVAQGSQGPRTYRFSAQRVRATRRQARRGTVGRLAPEPGRQRAPLLPVQRSRGHNLGDSGLRGWVQVAH